jgi:DNA sulfur modification protein DndD
MMSKRLHQGKGDEFARAVRSLLGLDALTAAKEHLKGAIKSYDKKYDGKSDNRITDYNLQIVKLDSEIENIDTKLLDISREEVPVDEKIGELQTLIEQNKMSTDLAEKKKRLIARRDALVSQKSRNIGELLSIFKYAPAYFAKKMIYNSLQLLKDTRKIDKGIPSVNAQTIKHLIERGRCICGSEVCDGNDAFIELTNLFGYVPPKSIGESISDFRDKCKNKVRDSASMFTNFRAKYDDVCAFDDDYTKAEQEILDINNQLLGMNDIGKLQADLMRYHAQRHKLQEDKDNLNRRKGGFETEYKRIETERDKLTLKDGNNRRVRIFRAYAQYMYNILCERYAEEEKHIREKLEETINEIFHNILGKGFTLKLSEKYDILVELSEFEGSAETSTAQEISIIFAFIAGVIQMARECQQTNTGLLVSEPYPLVMDAPLSNFDTTRIQTICDVLPNIAEQIIIFTKDTDGEIAEKYLGSRIGIKRTLNAVSNIETYIM